MTTISTEAYSLGDHTKVVTLDGELDISVSSETEEAIENAADGTSTLVLDLRRLGFIDSTGIRMILRLDSRLRSLGKSLALVSGSEPVDRVFRVTGLDKRLKFISDPAEMGDGS